MRLLYVAFVFLAAALVAPVALAGGPSLTVEIAHGSVSKADKDSLTLQPRTAGGQFGKALVLKLTGTSKLSAVGLEKRGGKLVPVQRDVEATDLEPGQPIAVIYAGGDDPVLLSGVVQRGSAKKK